MNTVRGIVAATAASPTARCVALGPLVELDFLCQEMVPIPATTLDDYRYRDHRS